MRIFGRPLRLLILDWDGVVLDLMACYWLMLERVAETMGLPQEPILAQEAGHYKGTRFGTATFGALLRETWPHLGSSDVQTFAEKFWRMEEEIGYPTVDGSVRAIRKFQRRGMPIAVCTMNSRAAMIWKLRAAGLRLEDFAVICTREDARCVKPDPRMVLPIFRAVPVPRECALYVGDHYPDFDLARNARLPFAAVMSGGIPRDAFEREGLRPNRIFRDLEDLARLVES